MGKYPWVTTCATAGCRCRVVRDGLCKSCLAAGAWDLVDTLPKSLSWLDLNRLANTRPVDGWQRYSLCAGKGTDRFFPGENDDTGTAKTARAICARCPAVYACLATCLQVQSQNLDHGIWGRTTVLERRRIRRALQAREDAA